MIHELKTAPVYFNRSWSGENLFEDGTFKVDPESIEPYP